MCLIASSFIKDLLIFMTHVSWPQITFSNCIAQLIFSKVTFWPILSLIFPSFILMERKRDLQLASLHHPEQRILLRKKMQLSPVSETHTQRQMAQLKEMPAVYAPAQKAH
jgi:hypothetical protein